MSEMLVLVAEVLLLLFGWLLIAAMFIEFVKRLRMTQDIEAFTDEFIAECCDVAVTERGLPDMRDNRKRR